MKHEFDTPYPITEEQLEQYIGKNIHVTVGGDWGIMTCYGKLDHHEPIDGEKCYMVNNGRSTIDGASLTIFPFSCIQWFGFKFRGAFTEIVLSTKAPAERRVEELHANY